MIGTSNIVLPGNKKSFPAPFQLKSRLHYYGTLFNSVEINSSFYKTPLYSTYLKWASEVDDSFTFTIKLSKAITHVKNLQADLALIPPFMAAAEGLKTKKGCLLIQFPGKITIEDFTAVEKILAEVKQYDWQVAVEFRHPSWYISETNELLQYYRMAMVFHDHPKAKILNANIESDFIYLRFHGPMGDYRGSYSDSFLFEQAAYINEWKGKNKEVFVYFNNTIGNAFANARFLQTLCS